MKKIQLFLFFIFPAFVSQAQQYVPFPTAKDSPVWRTIYYNRGRPTSIEYWINYSFTIDKDTVYNGKTYHKLPDNYMFYRRDNNGPLSANRNQNYYQMWFREENKRIYIVDTDFWSGESLLYDFNVKAGDTIKNYDGISEEFILILSVDSFLLTDGTYRKSYKQYDKYWGENIIVEGIGGIQQSFSGELECFSLGGKVIYRNNNPGKCGLRFAIFPNPTTGNFTIQTQSIFGDSYICVKDILGRIVHQEKLQFPNQTVNISNQPKGLYFVELYYNGNKNVKKVILE